MTLLNEAAAVRVGAVAVAAAYAGAAKVWPPARFAPIDLPGSLIWLDAAAVNAADGDPVPTWPDNSGNGFAAIKNTGDAVYHAAGINGHPAVRFGEFSFTDMRLVHGRTIGDRTVFQVIRTMGTSFGPYHTTQVQELDPYMQTYGNYNGTIHTYTTADVDSGVAWSGAPQFITLWCSAAAARHWLEVDGHQATQAWAPTSSSSQFYLGGFTPGGYATNGYIGEFIVYDRCLTDLERGQVQAYLAAKWAAP